MTEHAFAADFLIGASTAAHQIEGGNVNSSWWMFEHRAGTPIKEPSGDAADSYHRWPDDLDIVAEVGLDAYRFSIEWARDRACARRDLSSRAAALRPHDRRLPATGNRARRDPAPLHRAALALGGGRLDRT